MKKQVYKIDSTPTEIDWEKKFSVKALNRDSRVFYPFSEERDIAIIVFESENEFEVSNFLAKKVLWQGYDYEYTLYDAKNLSLVGFVLTIDTYEELEEIIEDEDD